MFSTLIALPSLHPRFVSGMSNGNTGRETRNIGVQNAAAGTTEKNPESDTRSIIVTNVDYTKAATEK